MPNGSKTSKPAKGLPRSKPDADLSLVDGPEVAQGDVKARREKPADDKPAIFKLKDLIDEVTEGSGAKRQDVKAIVEVTLARLGAVLGRGESLNLQGFGHLRVARKATADSPVMTLKLRQGEAGKDRVKPSVKSAKKDDTDTLAEDSDQG